MQHCPSISTDSNYDGNVILESCQCTAEEQLAAVWTQLEKRPQTAFAWPYFSDVRKAVLDSDYKKILQDKRDMHNESSKVICPNGFVCQIKIDWVHDTYTGLFRESTHSILRLSSALAPVEGSVPWFMKPVLGKVATSQLFPCAAMKCFRSHMHSGNLLFGGKKTGQEDRRFFLHPLTTSLTEKVPGPLRWVIDQFRQYSAYPTQLGLSDFARYNEDGSEVSTVEFPWLLALHPLEGVSDITFEALPSLPPGTPLYDLFGYPSPASALLSDGHGLQLLGRVSSSSCFLSSPADDGLFFKHQAREEDYDLRPQW
eukprot:CAMPEP_0182436346 /NCGR_PEP_ID=MMETSP1167-20130531/80997_1 /TAXON_ID=2988 /ORGANISM="Mallomonas Sp, Strain CCMP3275" /LENGTH=312 /DNA_ID=CAMNT_0024628413 /DNA_START=247 /DNA_END=1182 /DNA_ORIENTATION=+